MNALRTTCLALLLNVVSSNTSAQSELEGTLFTSPEQRAYLDYLRQEFLARSQERGFDITAAEIPDIPVDDAASEPAAPQIYTLSGIVSLRDGSRRIWLNGQEGASLVQVDGAPALRFRTDGGSHVVKPGQTLELTKGSVAETYFIEMTSPIENGAEAQSPDATSGAEADRPTTDTDQAVTILRTRPEPDVAVAPVSNPIAPSSEVTDAILQLSPEQAAELLQALQQMQIGVDDE